MLEKIRRERPDRVERKREREREREREGIVREDKKRET